MIQPDSFAKLFHLLDALQARAGVRTTFSVGVAASVAALTIILRLFTAKKPKLITDYAKVARKVDDSGLEFDEWDFIVVGGGTAGCVLASRLSEDPNLRVLLIEAGGSSKDVAFSKIPSAFSQLFRTHWDYHLYTEPQLHAGNKKKYWPRAKLLGGCSSMNAMIALYGSPSDFDEWAEMTGDESWSWNNFSKYIRKFEKYTPDPRFPQVDPLLRGANGPVEIGYSTHVWPASEAFVQASMNAGIPFSPDFCTTKGTKGTNKSTRVSTESAYLTDEVLARPNLKVVTYARVAKILFDSSAGTPRATGVEFAGRSPMGGIGPKFRVRATKEVIVCGGAVHSPQILMLSGIGPAAHLSQHNIPVLLDAPGVGANLTDHPAFNLRLKEKTGTTFNHLKPYNLRTARLLIRDLLRYQLWGTGPIASNIGETAAFFRSDDPVLFSPAEYNHDIEDATSGPDAPDLEILMCAAAVHSHNIPIDRKSHMYQMIVILLRPTSKGSILLKSTDPYDDPLLDPSYLETKHDIDTLVRGVRAAFKIAHTAPMTSVTDVQSTHPLLDHHFSRLSDAELADIIRDRVETVYHPIGTCSMGPGGVVDSDLRVKGTRGLRVCDASVFPTLVSGHPAGAVIATAEKLADVIKAQYCTK
ncbi:alcohol oxidase [Rhizopogon salebrosus TDB-379]|nr:alcohol oxidase [Rhizopogon salebrosus TDB-379]